MSAPVTFADFAALNGVGVVWMVDVSLDEFATYFKNYSTVGFQETAGFTPLYDPRIVSMGKVSRAFGASPGFAAGTFSLELQNIDGGVDWLIDRTTYASQALRAKFQLAVYLYNPNDFSQRAYKALGTFMLMDPPTRTIETVKLTLGDDTLGDVATMAPTPSIRDWMGITDANRPALLTTSAIDTGQVGLVPDFDYDAPTPLLFGGNLMPITRVGFDAYVICAVSGSAGALPMGISKVVLGNGFVMPATVAKTASTTAPTYTVRRTPAITKNGRTFHLLWLDLDLSGKYASTTDEFLGMKALLKSAGYDKEIFINDWATHDLVGPISVTGYLFSHPTNDVTASQQVHGATIVQDLITYYARRSSAPVDTASFDAVRAARPNFAASGIVEAGVNLATTDHGGTFHELVDGTLVKAIRGICVAGGFDVFCDWAGNIRASAFVSDYAAQTASFATLDETLLLADSTSEKIPATGERNAPYNRLFFSIGGVRYGPLQDEAAIVAWGKVVAKQVDAEWVPVLLNVLNPFPNGVGINPYANPRAFQPALKTTPYAAMAGSTIRPVVTTSTFLNGLTLELGDFIYFSWSRGTLGGPYVNSTFRVEGITLDPMSCTVELTLLWVDDLRTATNLPYLLDDETLNTRCAGSGGRTATLALASAVVTISSGNLVSDGVVVGDNFIARDATEAINAFTRNQVFRITAVTTTTVTLAGISGFAGGPYVISTWEIQASAVTYRPNVTYFGKTVDSAGLFSNGATGNKLLEG